TTRSPEPVSDRPLHRCAGILHRNQFRPATLCPSLCGKLLRKQKTEQTRARANVITTHVGGMERLAPTPQIPIQTKRLKHRRRRDCLLQTAFLPRYEGAYSNRGSSLKISRERSDIYIPLLERRGGRDIKKMPRSLL